MAKTLVLEAEVVEKETIADIQRTNLVYLLAHTLSFTQSFVVDWNVANATSNVELDFPPGITTVTGLVVRINKAAGSTASVILRLNGNSGTAITVSESLILIGTSITSVHVTNTSGSAVETKFHLLS